MSYRELDIKISYISRGEDGLAKAFIVPMLKHTKHYKRSVGFFSSGVFNLILDGLVGLARNGGKIQLIASPRLSEEDIAAINNGYNKREEILNNTFSNDFVSAIDDFKDSELHLLADLIARGILDIKIAVTDSLGEYHDKLGVMEDNEGNVVVFYGSSNSSKNGYKDNYEKIRVAKSWIRGQEEIIDDESGEFDSLWDNTNPYVNVYEYSESAKMNILKIVEQREMSSSINAPIVLRDYQEEAISAWVNNDYHGFFVMATGTGKTWTAIYAAKRLISVNPAMIIISAPYKHLVKQWADDVQKVFPDGKIIMVSSENPLWEQQIAKEIIGKRYNENAQIIIISTLASFKRQRFMDVVSKSKEKKLLIIDEAHRFTDRKEEFKTTFTYMLGLSATPFSGISANKGLELMSFFGGQVFNLPIERALELKYLVPYNYYPIFVHATPEEEGRFKYHSQKIAGCFRNNRCINSDLLIKSLRNRLRIISMAEEKQNNIDNILEYMKERDHVVVYCGDGRLFDNETGDEIRHIQSIKRILTQHEYKASQFTAKEDMKTRMDLVDAFNKGEISALAAIRCLDEGINIPSIQSALILSSNDDYREFVQRRGRILRLYENKEYANIYDVIVLPSSDMQAWAKIELRRFYEYGKLAKNWSTLEEELDNYMVFYNLTFEDIDVYDYENMEENEDE